MGAARIRITNQQVPAAPRVLSLKFHEVAQTISIYIEFPALTVFSLVGVNL